MKILQIVPSLDPAEGGPNEVARQIAIVLESMGHQSDIATTDPQDAPWLRGFPVQVYALGPGKMKYGYSGSFVPWLRKHAGEYDAVIVRGIWQYTSYGAWKALKGSGTPYFVFTHGMLDPWFKRTYPLKHLKKLLYWQLREQRVLRDARKVLFTSKQERIMARKPFPFYKCDEEVVVYGTATPPQRTDVRVERFFDEFPGLRGKRLILFLGRIHPKKGCDLLIKAFARIAGENEEIHLVMAGPDQLRWRGRLKKESVRRNIEDKVTWTGMLSGDLKWGAFHSAEVFILPSHQENFGIAVAEALGCGVPVLISNKVNIWREIREDGAGIVSNDDLEGTATLLRGWLDMGDEDRQEMRDRAKLCFDKRFEIHKAVEHLLDIINENRSGK